MELLNAALIFNIQMIPSKGDHLVGGREEELELSSSSPENIIRISGRIKLSM